jgi:hypothetical protein
MQTLAQFVWLINTRVFNRSSVFYTSLPLGFDFQIKPIFPNITDFSQSTTLVHAEF